MRHNEWMAIYIYVYIYISNQLKILLTLFMERKYIIDDVSYQISIGNCTYDGENEDIDEAAIVDHKDKVDNEIA